jgi:hypothetical protein
LGDNSLQDIEMHKDLINLDLISSSSKPPQIIQSRDQIDEEENADIDISRISPLSEQNHINKQVPKDVNYAKVYY